MDHAPNWQMFQVKVHMPTPTPQTGAHAITTVMEINGVFCWQWPTLILPPSLQAFQQAAAWYVKS